MALSRRLTVWNDVHKYNRNPKSEDVFGSFPSRIFNSHENNYIQNQHIYIMNDDTIRFNNVVVDLCCN